ncbi:hypothetical protein MPB2EB_1126 [Mycoavidus sp. B2-EB]|nr:hypothetical protein MPB2EB_1126 [Mycoavidus sp. B2-EB]
MLLCLQTLTPLHKTSIEQLIFIKPFLLLYTKKSKHQVTKVYFERRQVELVSNTGTSKWSIVARDIARSL